jgi:hypothetical protein
MDIASIKSELIAAENLNSVRRRRGKYSLNLGTELAEELSAIMYSRLKSTLYEVAIASTKGYDISTDKHKIEVKSVASMHRNIGNLKDKTISDNITVIWFSENTLLNVERVIEYKTEEVLEGVKSDGNKKGLFTYKMQKEWFSNKRGKDLTEEFRKTINEVLSF